MALLTQIYPEAICTSVWFGHTLTMHARSGTPTSLKTRKYWRMRKSLPVGWQLTNGILAIRTYFNCINYHPWTG